MLLLSISGCFLAIFKNNYKLSFSIIILPWLIGYGLQTFDWTTVHGEPFEGDDKAWDQYLHDNLPNEEDVAELNEYFKQEWIQYREWKD